MNARFIASRVAESLERGQIEALKIAVRSGKSAKEAIDEIPDGVKEDAGFFAKRFLSGAVDSVLPGMGELTEEVYEEVVEKL